MSNNLYFYRLDVLLARFRRRIKKLLPRPVLMHGERLKNEKRRILSAAQMLLDGGYPWMSPNIWEEIVSFYRGIDSPTVFEFGTGASSLFHFSELVKLDKGCYIGVEHDPQWFWNVVAAFFNMAHKLNFNITATMNKNKIEEPAVDERNVDVKIECGGVTVLLRLRPSLRTYLASFDIPCDVVVIDGISRKECVRKILSTQQLKKGGLLMLMEAGRGSDKWWEGKLDGENDYSPEVSTLLSIGGVLMDGNGADNWPGCPKRSSRPISYFCPMEACKLIMP